MHKQEIHENSRKFKKRVVLNKSNFTHMDPTKSILYVLPYCSDFAAERNLPWNHSWMYIPIDWKNPQLVDALTHMIRPIDETLLQVNIPADRISIAVHVRKGTGFDGALLAGAAVKDTKVAYADINVPLKFPPDSYYIEQIKHISELLNHAPLYVFIFTDHDKPAELIEKFKRELPGGTNIEWGFREHGNSHTANVVEDFFAMTLFDCLIYCQSNYSYMASKIARYRISIYPTKHHWQGTQSIVDQVEVVDNRLSFN
jgi:hypothetical protein